ncbi:hypothetical protein ACNS7O_01705 [Haloferacaceae archaeon DSL9]
MSALERVVRDHLLAAHADVLGATIACADSVAASWSPDPSSGAPATTDRDAVVGPLRATLRGAGVLSAFPPTLSAAVAATGETLSAPPVAAPPYVAITSTGPVLRATLPPGRLVIELVVFAVERRADDPRYTRRGETGEEILRVSLR